MDRKENQRLQELVDTISSIASLKFDKKASVFNDGGNMDVLAHGLNMLAEEWEDTVVSRAEVEKSEKMLKEAQEIGKIGHWRLDLRNNILLWSDMIYEIFGIDPDEFGASLEAFLDAVHPDDRKLVQEAYTSSVENKTQYDIDHRILLKNGEIKWVHESGKTTYDSKGNPMWSLGTVQDITERKSMEAYRIVMSRAFESASEGILITDPKQPDNPVIYTNKKFSEITGYSKEDALGRNCRFLQGKDTNNSTRKAIRQSIKALKPFKGEILNYKKDGTPFWNRLTVSPVFNESGELINFVGIQHDITQRKQNEQDLKLYKERTEKLHNITASDKPFEEQMMEVLELTTGQLGMEGGMLAKVGNAKYTILYGYPSGPDTRAQLKFDLKNSFCELVFTKGKLVTVPSVKKSKRKNLKCNYRKNAKSFIGVPVKTKGKKIGALYFGSSREVDEFKQVDIDFLTSVGQWVNTARDKHLYAAELVQSNASLREAQKTANLGNWNWDLVNNKVTWSDQLYTIFEVDPGEYNASYESYLQLVHPAEQVEVDSLIGKAIETSEPYAIDHRLVVKGGKEKYVVSKGTVNLDKDGKPVSVFGILQDITDFKKTQISLVESMQMLDQSQRMAHVGHWEWDLLEKRGVASDEFFRIMGYHRGNTEISYEGFLGHILEEDRQLFSDTTEKAFDKNEPQAVNLRVRTNQNTECILHTSIEVIQEGNIPARIMVVVQDVTDREVRERMINELNQQLKTSLEAADAGVFHYDFINGISTWDLRSARFYGFDEPQKIEDDEMRKLLHPEDVDVIERFKKLPKGHFTSSYRIIDNDGNIRFIKGTGRVSVDNLGKPISAIGINQDITDEKLLELELENNLIFHEALGKIALGFNNPGSFESKMNDALNVLGEVTNVENSFIYEFDGDDVFLEKKYNWTKNGERDESEPAIITAEEVPALLSISGQDVIINNDITSELTSLIKEKLITGDTKSIVLFPISTDKSLFGFLGLKTTEYRRTWLQTEADLVKTTSGIIANAYSGYLAQVALTENEQRLRYILENTKDLLCLHDPDGKYLEVTPSIRYITGYDHEEMIGKDPSDFFHPEDLERVKEENNRMIRKGSYKNAQVTYRYRHKNGNYLWFETISEPIMDENGVVKHILTSTRDVTERKKIQQRDELINAITQELNKDLDLTTFFDKVSEQVNKVISVNSLFITMYDKKMKELSFKYVLRNGKRIKKLPPARVNGNGLTDYVIRTNKGLLLNGADLRRFRKKQKLAAYGKTPESWVGVPLEKDDRPIGALTLKSWSADTVYTERDLELLVFVGTQIGSFISRKIAEEEIQQLYQNLEKKVTERTLELQEYANKLELAQKVGGIGMWELDLSSNELVWDDQMYKLYGVRKKNVSGKYDMWSQLVHPDDLGPAVEKLGQTIKSRKDFDTEFRIITPKGKIKYIRALAKVVLSKNKPSHLLGVNWDITDLKNTEMSLRESETFFNAIFENIPNMVFMKESSDLSYVAFNKAGEELMGLQRKNVIGRSDYDLLPKESADRHVKEDRKVLGTNRTKTIEKEAIESAVKGTRLVRTKKVPVQIGTDQYLLGITEDITDLIKHQEEIKQQIMAMNESAIVSETDLEGGITAVNDNFCRISGYARKELIGRNHRILKSGMQPDSLFTAMWKTISLGKIWKGEVLNKKKGSGYYWVDTTIVPFRDANGVIEKYVSIRFDITKQKEQQEKLLEQKKALEIANEELESFSYSVSHDLRAPLRALQGFSRLIVDKYTGKLDDQAQVWLDFIASNATKMDSLINDILIFSRISRSEIVKSQFNVYQMVQDIIEEQKTKYKNEMKITVQPLPDGYGDQTMFNQLWTNLIANAFKFSSKKETIRISITGRETKTQCTYTIKDNGAGFNPDYANKVFEVFQRLHREDEFEGTGVGLGIVKRIINKHDGEITAEGSIGKGAKFIFNVPKKPEIKP